MFNEDKQIEDFMQFRNEFELHSSDSNYETDCNSEENFVGEEEQSPELADVNILSTKLKNKTEMIAALETEELETMQYKDHSLPKGLAPLEELDRKGVV